jgi:hypothetical protein
MQVAAAISRFFGFFFALLVTIAVVIASYSIVAGQPVDKTWSAVEALTIASIAVLVLAVAATLVRDVMEREWPKRAARTETIEGGTPQL